MAPDSLRLLLEQLCGGEVSIDDAVRSLSAGKTAEATVDLDRAQRCGYPEVVFAEGKTTNAIIEIIEVLLERGQIPLVTRLSPEQSNELRNRFPQGLFQDVARTLRFDSQGELIADRIAIVTAGSGDRPVAEEAAETLRWQGFEPRMIIDVGVAGPHRLWEHVETLRTMRTIIVAAGMEGALPSVVGGYVSVPVISVPTSVGYGAGAGGFAALAGMLTSCAANVCVVNIDAGFKAGYVAGLIAKDAENGTG